MTPIENVSTLFRILPGSGSGSMRRLPPIAELLAFESVARHLSFTRAAVELCITQSAVSHRVRRLEQYYGKQLIERLNPGLALTEAGAALLPELTAVLNAFERLGGQRERRLRVAAGSALCTWWLAKRLPAFMRERPGISIDLLPIENDATSIPQVDVRILWIGDGQESKTPSQQPLFNELVFPVCSPKLLPGSSPPSSHRALTELPLLHKAAHGEGEWSWRQWFERLGLNYRERRGGELRFADMGLLLAAATDGAGVGLSRSLLVHDALQEGRLAIPIRDFEPIRSRKQHVARWQRARAEDPDIRSFVTWLATEAERTLQATEAWVRGGAIVNRSSRASRRTG